MFQSFDVKGGRSVGHKTLPKLRAELERQGLDGVIIPHEDEHQNEYLPEANERLAWATGFTGSAGAALVLTDAAYLFVDGRYTVQGAAQTDPDLFEVRDLVAEGVAGWLKAHGPEGARIGYDPRLHTPNAVSRLEAAAKQCSARLVALEQNPIDIAWTDRPAPPRTLLRVHPIAVAGESHEDKRARLGADLNAVSIDAAVLTSPVSLAWLLNLRGDDVRHTPAPLGNVILRSDGSAVLFVHPDKVTDEVRAHLGNAVSIADEDAFAGALAGLSGARVRVDPAETSQAVFSALEAGGAQIERGDDPCALPRACKNPVEVEGARVAHRRDGIAVTRFIHWLETEAQSGAFDEIEAALKLEGFRRECTELTDLSFETISAAGPDGALPHYRVNTASNRTLAPGTLYLCDSGGQYKDGTTDVTRVVAIGAPSGEMRERYTLVLQGHIALALARFPAGTTGAHLDAFARRPLWEAGLDFDHGTGHGVGSYLSVHEGPQRIAKGQNTTALMPGMIVSNEPGYYKEGAYGIRIENLQVVTPASEVAGGERPMLGFETLTLAPLARRLIVTAMLSPTDRAWVDAYHARVLAEIGPQLEDNTVKTWLEAACAPL